MTLLNKFDQFFERDEPQNRATSAPTEISGGAILAVDVGNVTTRAVLLDVVDGQFRFVARGETPTTAGPPFKDIFEGVRRAVQEIANATGRQIMDSKAQFIMPEQSDFYGISTFAATASAGEPIRTILIGLVPDVSLASGTRAAESTYLRLVDTFSLADGRNREQQIAAILKAEPDMMLIVGGTDGGAMESLRNQIHTVTLASTLMERQFRPAALFAGNKDMQEEVRERLGEEQGMRVLVSDNVRPTLDMEQLDSAQTQLAAMYHAEKSSNTGGFADLGSWTKNGVLPTAHGFSRMVRILSQMEGQDVLGIDIGSAATAITASIKGGHYLNVFDRLGVGHSATGILEGMRPEALTRWLTTAPRDADEVVDYLHNKTLYPHTVPTEKLELEIEFALTREIIRRAVLSARATWRGVRRRGLLPPFGKLLLSGNALTRPPHPGWSVLAALDSLLPVGITEILLDPFAMAPALGAIAPQNPAAVVQVLDTGAFFNLGTVVSLSGRGRRGEIVLRGSFKPDGVGKPENFEAAYGTISTIPLPSGVACEVILQPRRGEVEIGQRGRTMKLKITGGEMGLIVDARGRPWRAPSDVQERRALLLEWQESITK